MLMLKIEMGLCVLKVHCKKLININEDIDMIDTRELASCVFFV